MLNEQEAEEFYHTMLNNSAEDSYEYVTGGLLSSSSDSSSSSNTHHQQNQSNGFAPPFVEDTYAGAPSLSVNAIDPFFNPYPVRPQLPTSHTILSQASVASNSDLSGSSRAASVPIVYEPFEDPSPERHTSFCHKGCMPNKKKSAYHSKIWPHVRVSCCKFIILSHVNCSNTI